MNMRILANENEIRQTLHEVVRLFANDQFESVIDLLYPPHDRAKTIQEMKDGISTHGTYDPDYLSGYRVLPLEERYREAFEKFLEVDMDSLYGLDPNVYSGVASCFLPLNEEYEGDVSDLKILFAIRRLDDNFCLEFLQIRTT